MTPTPTVAMGQLRRVRHIGVYRCPSCGRDGTDALLLALDGHLSCGVWCSEHARILIHALLRPSTALESL